MSRESLEIQDRDAALSRERDTRRKLASMCETVMQVVLTIEKLSDCSELDDAANKLRAAVLAAT